MHLAVTGERGKKARDAGCPTLLQPFDQLAAAPNTKPTEIENVELCPSRRMQPGNALQGLGVAVEGRPAKDAERKVMAAVRLSPIVETVDQRFEPPER